MTTLRDSVRIDNIVIRDGRRRLDASRVRALADSIREIGLLNPPVVTYDDDPKSRKLWLVAGAHRVEAAKLLEWDSIDVLILVDYQDLLCELAEIDENLVRHNLTKIEESDALRRRKAIYEGLHPETKHGKSLKGSDSLAKKDDKLASFSADTSAKTGRSARSIQRSVDLGSDLDAGAKAILASEPKAANNATAIKAVEKAGSPEKQREAAKEAVDKARAPKPKFGPGKGRKPKNSPAIPPEHMDPPKAPAPHCADPIPEKRPHYDIDVDQIGDDRWEARCKQPPAFASGTTRRQAMTELARVMDGLGLP